MVNPRAQSAAALGWLVTLGVMGYLLAPNSTKA